MSKISTDRDIHLSPNEAAIVFRDGLQLDLIAGTGETVKIDSPTFLMAVVGSLFKPENAAVLTKLTQFTITGLNAQRDSHEAAESLISRAQENPNA